MRLLYSCSELGLGHASRTIALGKRLEAQGHDVFFFSGGRAHQLLRAEFKQVYHCAPVAWYENAHGIITSASVVNILFPLPVFDGDKRKFGVKNSSAMETIHRYYDLRRHVREIEPDLLVSDGDIHALRLAHRWHIPAVYIANLIRPSYGFSPFLSPGERFTERYLKKCLKIVVPDNPSPFTVSEFNIGDLESVGIRKKVEFVGSFTDTTPVEGTEVHIFAPISGPSGTRAKLMRILLPVLGKLAKKSVVSLGKPGGKQTVKMGNCMVHNWLSSDQRKECMKNASLVVFSGGHITCFETIKYAKPSVCVPTQPEQLGNSIKLQQLGCSLVAKNKTQVGHAIVEIENEQSIFRGNVEKLNRFSNKFNGLDRTTEIIGTILQ